MTIPVGFAQANWFFTGQAAPTGAQCTMGIDITGEPDAPNLLAENLWDSWRDTILTQQTSSLNLVQTTVKYGPDATGETGIFSQSAPGTAASTCLAPNTSYLVQKTTSFGGRAGRGRMFVPGTIEAGVGPDGIVTVGTLAALQAQLDLFLAELIAEGHPPVVLHGDSSPLSTPSPVTGLPASGTVATQRRRLRR
jgi:hypothetical protein